MTTLRRLPVAAQVLAAAVVLYAFAYVLPGTGPMLGRNAPVAIIAVGVIYGVVTGLGALALILTYRSSRFVNFAYGAMGSLVGVLAIGLYKEHDVPFLVVLPLGVIGGAATGIAVELLLLRRFRDASRLVLTVASIGLAQLLGGLELLGSKAMGFVTLSGAFKVPSGIELGPRSQDARRRRAPHRRHRTGGARRAGVVPASHRPRHCCQGRGRERRARPRARHPGAAEHHDRVGDRRCPRRARPSS